MPHPKLRIAERSAEQLAADAAAGCPASFELLVRRFGPRLLRYLRQRLGDGHAAEDLLQDTFLKAYRSLGRYDPARSFATWLFTIATRLAASHHRRRARVPVPTDQVDPPDRRQVGPVEAAARRELHAGLWDRAAHVLPDSQYAALCLRYVEEMPVGEIAAAMGRSTTSVKVLLHRARRRLARLGAAGAADARVPPAPRVAEA